MTPADLRVPPEPERTPLTDAELVDAPREVARMLAARNTEPDAVSIEDEQRRIAPYHDRLFVFQARVTTSPAETLRGSAAKLRVMFDPDNGPCAGNLERHEFAAVSQVVEVIERAITPPPDNADAALLDAERELLAMVPPLETDPNGGSATEWQRFGALETFIANTPALTLVGAAVKLRRLADPAQGIDAINANYHLTGLTQALAVVEREAAMSVGDGMSNTEDAALIEAERDFHEAGAALDKWKAENPGVDLDDSAEWERVESIFWKRILAAEPAGVDGTVVILRALTHRDLGLQGGMPKNLGDILARVLRGCERGVAAQPEDPARRQGSGRDSLGWRATGDLKPGLDIDELAPSVRRGFFYAPSVRVT